MMEWNMGSLCACLGPQNGEPLCPCAMNRVRVVNDRYVNKDTNEDLGAFVKINKSRVEQASWNDGCPHADHNPNFAVINGLEMGQVYIHVCPQCKAEYRCMPTTETFLKEMFKDEEKG